MHTSSSCYHPVSDSGMTTPTNPARHMCVAACLWNAVGSHHCPSIPGKTVPPVTGNGIKVTMQIAAVIITPISGGLLKFVVP